MPRVRLHPHGLDLGARGVLPLVSAAMHYWRLDPRSWARGLDAIKSMGFRLVDTYVPWGEHEVSPGVFDFGEREPRKDVAAFLRMAHERGLYVLLRPGPHINAELSFFGLPERIVWDPACQARTPRQNPVMLPMVPLAFPVPSYASDAFQEETVRWYQAVAARTAGLRFPEGPIVLVQVDNEGALYFRDGPYDQDYHPDAIRLFRTMLAEKYPSEEALRAAWREPRITFDSAEPPRRFDAREADDLPRHMDWLEFHEYLLTQAMDRMAKALAAAGLSEIPTAHNFPPGEAATPLNAARVMGVVDLVGLDYYHRATPGEHTVIMRRTTELALRSEGAGAPAFAAEMGAGFPPFFPPIDEVDSLYTLVAALAYGLRGFNLYMAVERDRWIGAPIDPHGQRRPFADTYERLLLALDRNRFNTLSRRAPVRLVVPRSLRRLARATHAFGPATPALFNVVGAGFREGCLEEDFGTGEVPTIAAEAYLRAFERALTARGVPFGYAGGESAEAIIRGASWIIVALGLGAKLELVASLRDAAEKGRKVTVGPTIPDRDGTMRRLGAPLDLTGLEVFPLDDVAGADALVARRIDELRLPVYPVDPHGCFACVHEDETGAAKLVFLLNPTPEPVRAKVALAGVKALIDALRGGRIVKSGGGFEVALSGRGVAILEVERAG